jgi:hypothetical protein
LRDSLAQINRNSGQLIAKRKAGDFYWSRRSQATAEDGEDRALGDAAARQLIRGEAGRVDDAAAEDERRSSSATLREAP